MKSYTDLEQSKKLAEFLPLESADYHYIAQGEKSYHYSYSLSNDAIEQYNGDIKYIPCWSLSALLSVIRKTVGYEVLCLDKENITIKCELGDEPWSIEINKDNEVDACYETILKLHELDVL